MFTGGSSLTFGCPSPEERDCLTDLEESDDDEHDAAADNGGGGDEDGSNSSDEHDQVTMSHSVVSAFGATNPRQVLAESRTQWTCGE